MSVFSKRENLALPLMTVVAQVDASSFEELRFVYNRWLFGRENLVMPEEDLTGFGQACELAQDVLREIYEHEALGRPTYRRINELLDKTTNKPVLLCSDHQSSLTPFNGRPFLHGNYVSSEGEMIPLAHLTPSETPVSEGEHHVAMEILNTVNICKNKIVTIIRCPVCKSFFMDLRPDQKYCSNRCGARMRNRRAYENKSKKAPIHTA